MPSGVGLPSSRLIIASIQQQGSGLPASAPLFSRELWLGSAVIIISILMTETKKDEQPRPEVTQLARHRLSLKLWLPCHASAQYQACPSIACSAQTSVPHISPCYFISAAFLYYISSGAYSLKLSGLPVVFLLQIIVMDIFADQSLLIPWD